MGRLERKANSMGNSLLRTISKHAVVYFIIAFVAYLSLLSARKYFGFFEFPILIALTEFNWMIMVLILATIFGGAHGLIKHRRGKK